MFGREVLVDVALVGLYSVLISGAFFLPSYHLTYGGSGAFFVIIVASLFLGLKVDDYARTLKIVLLGSLLSMPIIFGVARLIPFKESLTVFTPPYAYSEQEWFDMYLIISCVVHSIASIFLAVLVTSFKVLPKLVYIPLVVAVTAVLLWPKG